MGIWGPRVPVYLHQRLPGEEGLPGTEKNPVPFFGPGGDSVCKHTNTHTHTRGHTDTQPNIILNKARLQRTSTHNARHLGRRITQSSSVSMEPPLSICKSKSEIKPPLTSSSLSTSSSSLQPQQPQYQQQQQQTLLPLKSDDP